LFGLVVVLSTITGIKSKYVSMIVGERFVFDIDLIDRLPPYGFLGCTARRRRRIYSVEYDAEFQSESSKLSPSSDDITITRIGSVSQTKQGLGFIWSADVDDSDNDK